MTEAFFLGSGEGRAFSNGIGRAQVKLEPGLARGFAIFESELPPGSGGPPLHLHHDYDEAFYVLDGCVTFWVGQVQRDCGPGSVVYAPRGSEHRFENRSEDPARLLVVLTPKGVELVESLGSVAADPGAARALWEQHRSRVVSEARP